MGDLHLHFIMLITYFDCVHYLENYYLPTFLEQVLLQFSGLLPIPKHSYSLFVLRRMVYSGCDDWCQHGSLVTFNLDLNSTSFDL